MKTGTIIKRLYWKWEDSRFRDPIHWLLFFLIGIFLVIHLVESISRTASHVDRFGINSSTTQELLNEK